MSDRWNDKSKKNTIIVMIMMVLTSLVYFGIFVWMCSVSQGRGTIRENAVWIGTFYVLTEALIAILFVWMGRKRYMHFGSESNLLPSNITLDFIAKLYMPVVICDNSGKIVWYNKAAARAVNSREVLYGSYVDAFCNANISSIMDCDRDGGLDVSVTEKISLEMSGGTKRFYRVKGYRFSAQSQTYCFLIFAENTEYMQLSRRVADENTIVAYAMIDNLEELLQQADEGYRNAVNDVEEILKRWAVSVGGIVKEYERQKYVLIFENRYLDQLIENKFPMLDDIREVRVGDANIPVTISMGISRMKGTLAEKEKHAKESMDMALQRGGDQVVLKTLDGVEFYGGRTKTVQKRTKVRARVIASELLMHISRSHNVLVMGHRMADFDSFGACVGIIRLAKFCGVPVNAVVDVNDSNIAPALEKLAGKADYDGIFIDSQHALDMIRSDTLLIIVDVNNCQLFEAPDLFESVANVVIIDHHRKTAEFKNTPVLSYIEPSASSACELISELLEQVLPIGSLPKDEADLMFAGILLDTKQFSRNTGVRTFSAALYLRSEGANPVDAQTVFHTSFEDFMRVAKFESNVVIYRDSIAIALCDSDGDPADRIAAAKAADKLLTVSGVGASFALCRINNVVHISARSQNNINVQLILEKLDGGGHFDNAGAQLSDISMSEALILLKKAIDDYL